VAICWMVLGPNKPLQLTKSAWHGDTAGKLRAPPSLRH
jgi:hypothetical protein